MAASLWGHWLGGRKPQIDRHGPLSLPGPSEGPCRSWRGPGARRDDLAKRSINALVGLWGVEEAFSYKLFSSSYKEDAPRDTWATQTFSYPGGQVYDFILRSQARLLHQPQAAARPVPLHRGGARGADDLRRKASGGDGLRV